MSLQRTAITLTRTLNRSLPKPARRHASHRASSSSGVSRQWRIAGAATVLIGSAAAAHAYLDQHRIYADEASHPVAKVGGGRGLIPMSEVEGHNSKDDLWVVINGQVYDLTQFVEDHPGGAAPILRAAGKDASHIFNPIHPPGTIEDGLVDYPDALKGNVDPTTVKHVELPKENAGEQKKELLALGQVIGLPDFAEGAQQRLTPKAWAYYSAGATDEFTLGLNRSCYQDILFRPRIMNDVEEVDTRTTFLGHETSLPIFICPCGMAKLSHPEGEALLAKGAGQCGIIQFISTNASAPLEAILGGSVSKAQNFFMQLYVDRKRNKSEALIKKIESMGQLKAIFVTVDAAAPGKREADERSRAEVEVASGISGGKIQTDNKGGGIGRSVGGFIDPKLNWEDIKWLRANTKLPIGLKGVQTAEDAKKAYDLGVDAIYLSNHGGRALDGAPPALYALLEINKFYPELVKDKKCEIYIDGGIRRGTDVVKALCLGANGVGLGRPFMYALTYGTEGVVHAIEVMRDEIETTLRLLGVTKLSQLGPHLINTKRLDQYISDAPIWGPDEQRR